MLRISRCFAIGLLGASVLVVFPRLARAEQFILLDATFDYTWEDATNSSPSKSHFYVSDGNFLNKQRPKNWLSPVDYRNGTLHVRTEVFKKPAGDQQVGWTLCYIPYSGGYGCADTTYYKSTGVFDRETKMTDWWNNSQLNWDQGVKQVDMIYAIDDSGSGHITNYPELKDLTTPTRVRVTMVQVSAGSTYDPSIIPGIGAGGSGGAGAGGNSGSSGAGGTMMLPLGGTGGSASGGMGGLLDMSGGSGGMPASSAGASSAGTSSSAGSSPVTATGAAGSGNLSGTPAGTADTSNDAGCSMSSAPQDIASLSGALAALSALALVRRTRRLLRR
ncbi:MAG TPA: hypothetical protein VHB79_32725 [Polyangiaceae bacterium]|nr:hypothetical protein [Polyangiaceae bacterium]